LDSSLLAHYVQRSSPNVSAYTITFPETTLDERRAAREVARALGMPHIELTAQRSPYLQELERAAIFNDDPVADPAFVPAMQVAEAASAHVKVLLAGTGADELFAGYGHYALPWRASIFRMLAPILGERAAVRAVGLALDGEAFAALREYGRSRRGWHVLAMSHLRPTDRTALAPLRSTDAGAEIAHRFAEGAAAGLDPINQQLCSDAASYLPHQLLSLLDRTTMAMSIEGRVPFLDHRLAEFALAVPGRRKLRWGRDKSLLRALAHRHLPPSVARRRKRGFPNGVGSWLAPEQLPSIRERLLDRMSFTRGFFPQRWLEQTLASGPDLSERTLLLHSLLVLETWHRTFLAARSAPAQTPAPAPVPA
jgi:asparagine synthase (glutamine-hydrolysing)